MKTFPIVLSEIVRYDVEHKFQNLWINFELFFYIRTTADFMILYGEKLHYICGLLTYVMCDTNYPLSCINCDLIVLFIQT